MPAAQGYIGRNPADSSTVIARQSFSPTGIQTDFTFAAGYEVGYVDLYLNGARLIEGQDFTATDGSTVGLTTNAVNGDVLEVVGFKAFNVANVTNAGGSFTVAQNLTVGGNTTVGTGITLDTNGNVNVSGVVTANSFVGDGTQLTGVGGGSVISGITIREEGSVIGTSGTVVNLNFVGADVTATAQAGFSTITVLAGAGGTWANFDSSAGISTTKKVKIENDFNVTGVGTFAGDVSIADKIIHTGDTNTAIRFPAADTITAETGGSERLRITSGGDIGIGNVTSPSTNIEIRTDANDEGILLKSTGSTSNALDFDANRSGAGNALASIRGKWNGTTVAQITFLAGSDTTNKDDGIITFGTESAASNGNANATERLRIASDNTTHVGERDGNQNSTIFGKGIFNIVGPDPINTSFTAAGVYLQVGGTESELNGLYPIGFGFRSSASTHVPAYIAYKTISSSGAEKGELLFATRDVTTDTQPSVRMTIGVGGTITIGDSTYGGDLGQLRIINDASSAPASLALFGHGNTTDGDTFGQIQFAEQEGGAAGQIKAKIEAQAVSTNERGSDLVFFTAANSASSVATERMRINSSGGVNITGVTTASQFDATSDVALKENIEVIDKPISKLSELKGVTFDWKKGGHSVGVIAQDVEKVLPTAVGGSKDQKTVNYNAIIGLLVESVKDQQKQIEELKSLLDK